MLLVWFNLIACVVPEIAYLAHFWQNDILYYVMPFPVLIE